MYLNRFSLVVSSGREVDHGYVQMKHGSEYVLRMRNDRDVDADAIVRIDGLEVGGWRIPSGQSISIERPVNIDRKFVFYKLGSAEGKQAGLSNDTNLGLISVDFIPAKQPIPMVAHPESSDLSSMPSIPSSGSGISPKAPSAARSVSPGGTGLGDYSQQKFGLAQPLDRDYSNQVTINLRLVAVDEPAIIPLWGTPVSNPIPPAII